SCACVAIVCFPLSSSSRSLHGALPSWSRKGSWRFSRKTRAHVRNSSRERGGQNETAPGFPGAVRGGGLGGDPPPDRLRHPRRRGDRKSTRLNSSRVKSSYAVFCLKQLT